MSRKTEESEVVVAGVLVPQRMILVITGYETRLTTPRPPRPQEESAEDHDGTEDGK